MYGKIFESMYDGTIAVNWKAMIVFQQLIILCDSEGVIDMTPPAISRRTNIPVDIIESGVKFLSEPDLYSRSKLHDGKRIIPIDEDRSWGWVIVNHSYYRNLASIEDKREKDRKRIAEKRRLEKEAQTTDSIDVSQGVAGCRDQSQMSHMQDTNTSSADADTKPPSDPTGSEGNGKPPPCPHVDIIKLHNEQLPELKGVIPSLWNGARKTRLINHWKENPKHQTLEFWTWFFQVVRANPHWMGENNRGWKADFGWLLKRENFNKVIEFGIDQQKRTNR